MSKKITITLVTEIEDVTECQWIWDSLRALVNGEPSKINGISIKNMYEGDLAHQKRELEDRQHRLEAAYIKVSGRSYEDDQDA